MKVLLKKNEKKERRAWDKSFAEDKRVGVWMRLECWIVRCGMADG